MNPFRDYLQNLNQRIRLPQPQKSRILLEISADLNDWYRHYLAEGKNEQEAHRAALERVDISGAELEELVRLHDSQLTRFMNRISQSTAGRWERWLFLLLVIFTVVFSGHAVFNHDFFLHSSIFITPVLGIAVLTVIQVVSRLYKIFLKKDHEIRRLREGIPAILFYGAAALLSGILGLFIDTFLTVSRIASDFANTLLYFIEWMTRISSMAVFTLYVVIFTAMVWFILYDKVLRIERAEFQLLVENNAEIVNKEL
jgi:hypothetical protein